MPSYSASPFAAIPQKLIPGQPAYLFGKWPQDTGPSLFAVTAVASSTTVLTYYVTLNAGNLPTTPYGVLSAYGLATDPQFNVTTATGVPVIPTGAFSGVNLQAAPVYSAVPNGTAAPVSRSVATTKSCFLSSRKSLLRPGAANSRFR